MQQQINKNTYPPNMKDKLMYKGQWQSHVRSWKGHGPLNFSFKKLISIDSCMGYPIFFSKKIQVYILPPPPPYSRSFFFIFYFLCIYFRNQILKVKIAWEEEGGPEDIHFNFFEKKSRITLINFF